MSTLSARSSHGDRSIIYWPSSRRRNARREKEEDGRVTRAGPVSSRVAAAGPDVGLVIGARTMEDPQKDTHLIDAADLMLSIMHWQIDMGN